MEQFEAWLDEHDIAIVGQMATGSGDLVVYQLKLPDGAQFDVTLSLEALVRSPDDAIRQVEERVREHAGRRRSNGA